MNGSITIRKKNRPYSEIEYKEMRNECEELLHLGKKRCYRCNKIKELSEFYHSGRLIENSAYPCHACTRDAHRVRKYGMEFGEFDERLKEQGYCCALCQRPLDLTMARTAHVDHNHKTGEVRGILCVFCNHALGLFEDRGLTAQFVQDYIDQKGYFENVRTNSRTTSDERGDLEAHQPGPRSDAGHDQHPHGQAGGARPEQTRVA